MKEVIEPEIQIDAGLDSFSRWSYLLGIDQRLRWALPDTDVVSPLLVLIKETLAKSKTAVLMPGNDAVFSGCLRNRLEYRLRLSISGKGQALGTALMLEFHELIDGVVRTR